MIDCFSNPDPTSDEIEYYDLDGEPDIDPDPIATVGALPPGWHVMDARRVELNDRRLRGTGTDADARELVTLITSMHKALDETS